MRGTHLDRGFEDLNLDAGRFVQTVFLHVDNLARITIDTP